MGIGRWGGMLLAILFVMSASRSSFADASSAAQARFDQGIAAMEKGDFASAVQAFNDAYEATKSTRYLWNLALAEIKANRPFDALQHLRMYATQVDASSQNVDRAGQLIERVRRDVGTLIIKAPDGANILVDGVPAGAAPLSAPFEVDPGKPHVVEARSGTRVAHENVPAPGAASANVTLTFAEPALAPPTVVAVAAPARAPREASYEVPREGLLIGIVVTETLAAAACSGIGFGVYREGNTHSDDTKTAIGATLMGAGALFIGAEILTLVLWPRPSPRTGMRFSPLVGNGAAGAAWGGAF